jgi:sulfite exporter TauE/SafE
MTPDLLLIFIGGLLGSAHCVGMCGAFALSIGASSPGWRPNLLRQFVYSLGRITTYTSAGAIAGYVGLRLNSTFAAAVPIQSILALAAGGFLIVQGLYATGFIPRRVAIGQNACLMPRFLSAFLLSPGFTNAFFAGVFTGFLPCGLVYAFLALASATANMTAGWLTMLAFGLGTLPIMVVTGLGSGLLTLAGRRRVLQLAGWCVVLAGAISMARGVGFLESAAAAPYGTARGLPQCPCCQE